MLAGRDWDLVIVPGQPPIPGSDSLARDIFENVGLLFLNGKTIILKMIQIGKSFKHYQIGKIELKISNFSCKYRFSCLKKY